MSDFKVTIGIPAHNEEANIGHLLHSLLKQREKNAIIGEIIVAADGCTDSTETIVRSFHDPRIHLISDGKRKGKPSRLTEIIERAKGDAIVFIDADHNISDPLFIQKIAAAFQKNPNVGLATCYVRPLEAKTFIESAVNNYHEAREHTINDYDFRHSIYALHGTYAVSQAFGHSIHFPKNILNEDAFVYLLAKTHNVGFSFVENTSIYFRSPQNIHDQMKQFQRHMKGGKQLEEYFGSKMVHDEFFVLFKAMFKIMIYQFAKNPLKYGTLRTLNFVNQFHAKRESHGYNALWAQIDSSKTLD